MAWTAALFLAALRDNLKLRPGLAGVQIAGAPVGGDDVENEVIAFIDINTTERAAAMGNQSREEQYTIEAAIEVNYPGSGDADADAARDRAAEILAEIEDEVRDNHEQGLGTLIRISEFTRKDLRQRVRENYRVALIEFDITVTTRI